MPPTDRVRDTLARYAEPLLREVTARPERPVEVVQFETWLGWAGTLTAPVFAPAEVADRARGEPLGLPALPTEKLGAATPRTADGLDWPLRLAVAWQRVDEAPVRLTQA